MSEQFRVDLPKKQKNHVEEAVKTGRFGTQAEYIRHLILRDMEVRDYAE